MPILMYPSPPMSVCHQQKLSRGTLPQTCMHEMLCRVLQSFSLSINEQGMFLGLADSANSVSATKQGTAGPCIGLRQWQTSATVLQIALWIFSGVTSSPEPSGVSRVLSCCFMAVVSLIAAAGFLVYGGRLFLMLRRSAAPCSGLLVPPGLPSAILMMCLLWCCRWRCQFILRSCC